jgi:hypothetical protein
MASPDREVSRSSQVAVTPKPRENVSKTAMNFAPVYEKRNSMFNQTLNLLNSSIEQTSPVRPTNTLPQIDVTTNYRNNRAGNHTTLPSERGKRNNQDYTSSIFSETGQQARLMKPRKNISALSK